MFVLPFMVNKDVYIRFRWGSMVTTGHRQNYKKSISNRFNSVVYSMRTATEI